MSQLHGKQLRDVSTSLGKLSGTGQVAFVSGATMSFDASASLTYAKVPTENIDVANKAYVDSVATGLDIKESARVIANTPVILNGLTTTSIDGVNLTDGMRVVVNGQGNAAAHADNGIYIVNAAGDWTRTLDFNESDEITGGQFIFITEGTSFGDTGFVVSTPDAAITVGSGVIKFTQFSSAGIIQAGLGLFQTGNTIDIITGTGLTASANEVKIADIVGLTTGAQGAATEVSTFTVNAQGQLTAAGSVAISIPSGQVNNFTASVNNEIFEGTNFVDSTNIDFNVTDGVSVTADLTNTTVTGGTYGVAGSVGTFTVDAKGRLTAASNTVIDITASQVSNFNTAAELAVIQAANFLDSTTIDFQVTAGATVSADIKVGSITEDLLDVTNTPIAGYVLATTGSNQFIWVNPAETGDITEVIAGDGLTGGGTVGSVTLNVNVNSDALELVNDEVKLKEVITGQRAFANGVTFSANTSFTGAAAYTTTGITASSDALAFANKGYVDGEVSTAVAAATTFAGDGLVKNGLTFSVNPQIAGNGLTYQILAGFGGVVSVNAGNGIALSGDNVVVDLAANSGLNFNNGDLQINPSIAGTGLAFSGGVLSIVAGSAQPQYDTFTSVSGGSGTTIGTLTASPNSFSRVEVYVNGLKVSAGFTTTNVGNLPAYTSQSVRFTGNAVSWSTNLYPLESTDVIEVVYEA